jgi:hypothetical protein
MKRFLIVGLLAFVGCELTESVPSEQVNSIFNDYSVNANTGRSLDSGVEVGKDQGVFTIQSWKKGEVSKTIIYTQETCIASNQKGCALVSCPADSASFLFCDVTTWGSDSLSFTYQGDTLKGRYFK